MHVARVLSNSKMIGCDGCVLSNSRVHVDLMVHLIAELQPDESGGIHECVSEIA